MTKKIKEMKNRRIRAENELMEEERIKRDEDKESFAHQGPYAAMRQGHNSRLLQGYRQ